MVATSAQSLTPSWSLPISADNSESDPGGLKVVVADESKESPKDESSPKHTCSGPDNVEAVPAVLEQTPAVVEELEKSPNKDACDEHLSKSHDSLEKVPTSPEQSPSGADQSEELHGNKASDKENMAGICSINEAGANSGGEEDRELLLTGPYEATPVDGRDLGSNSVSGMDGDHFEGNEVEVNALKKSPSKTTDKDAECLQVNVEITESSSNRDCSEETPLIAGKRHCRSDSCEPAPRAKRISQVEEQQSNCNNSIEDDSRKQS